MNLTFSLVAPELLPLSYYFRSEVFEPGFRSRFCDISLLIFISEHGLSSPVAVTLALNLGAGRILALQVESGGPGEVERAAPEGPGPGEDTVLTLLLPVCLLFIDYLSEGLRRVRKHGC
jgi:hypothetical protein